MTERAMFMTVLSIIRGFYSSFKGNHKGLPLHNMTVRRGNPTCKALTKKLNLMALRVGLGGEKEVPRVR